MATFNAGKVIKCKAAVAWKANGPLVIEEIQVEPPKTGEVRVKVAHLSYRNHTQWPLPLGSVRGMMSSLPFPAILGHEGAGIVESVGDGVSEFAPGDHVIAAVVPQCRTQVLRESAHQPLRGVRRPIWRGRRRTRRSTRPHARRNEQNHVQGSGAALLGIGSFAQYTVIQEHQLAKVSYDAPLDTICVLGCGITTGYGAVCETCKVPPGSRVAVWGLGAVGLTAVMGAKATRATQIIAIDTDPAKFEAAHRGWGVAYVVGLCLPTDLVNVSPALFITGRTLKGSLVGGYKAKDALPALVKDYQKGKLQLDSFITHRFSLEEVNKAVELLKAGKALRSVIALHSEDHRAFYLSKV